MGAWARTVDGIKREVMQGERHSTSTGTSHLDITSMVIRFAIACTPIMLMRGLRWLRQCW